MKKKKAAIFLAVCIAFGGAAGYSARPALMVNATLSSDKSDLEVQKREIEKELKQIEQDLKDTKSDIAKQQQYQSNLNQQIKLNLNKVTVLQQQLSALSDELAQKEVKLTEKEAELSGKETEIADTYERFKQRMRVMYMAGDTSTLQMLFEADSFADFLTNIEMMKAISAHDTDLVDQLEVEKGELQNAKSQLLQVKADLEDQQAQVESSKKELESTNKTLQAAYQESKTASQDLEEEQKNFEANIEQRKKEAKEIDNEIASVMKKIAEENAKKAQSGGNIVTEKGFLWPLPGFSNVNSGYGWRFNNSDFHTGLDLGGSGVYGANIVAAKSGVVSSSMTHWSYGNNVVINHGDGYVTLYAHCSQLLVSPGQTVTQGQVIAKVGSTGNVTGPHLHFEVYYNGVRQNPSGFIRY